MRSETTRNATSSRGSEGGHTPSSSRCGQTPDLFGQDHAHASHSPSQGGKKDSRTTGTSGRSGMSSSGNVSLSLSLASKLQELLSTVGSTLFRLTWRMKATPSGRRYFQLVASGHRTSGKGCGSWGTPNSSAPGGTPEQALKRKEGLKCGQSVTTLDHQVQTAWPTASARDGKGGYQNGRIRGGKLVTENLSEAVMVAWPTPQAKEQKESSEKKVARGAKPGLNLRDAAESAWPTPQHRDFRSGGGDRALNPDRSNNLNDYALLGNPREDKGGSPAKTENRGQLNPEFASWLMGYPPEWLNCAPSATPSARKRRQPSS